MATKPGRAGANIKGEGRTAVIKGVERLSGAPVKAADPRRGAGPGGAERRGGDEVEDIEHIARGY